MIHTINKDHTILSQKSRPATADDVWIADDLRETLAANAERCVGMAANMIGELVAIIVFDNEGTYMEMFNPVITQQSGSFEAVEGCLSLEGERKVKRYQYIKVKYQDRNMVSRQKRFSGWTAQIIQHEVDHLGGTII